ncbi:hypothetical protein Tco_1058128 [Tanacetum coccineum]|uniref:Reverse transcriptase domain-containing protein n=1 Tax=Tanacetum coccineum TaxID=301880 RepID=A0ABQ5H898_9ASTR
MTQAAIQQLITDGIVAALEAQATTSGISIGMLIIKKMEDEFYNLVVKGNDLKTYIRRFQELAILCPNMVPTPRNLWRLSSGDCPKALKETLLL